MTMSRGNLQMAFANVKSARWRSMLTMLGIIIGIVSVVMVVGIGQGVKHEISRQITQFGSDLVTIRPGAKAQSGKSVTSTDLLFGMNSVSGFTSKDLAAVKADPTVRLAAPLSIVSGSVETQDEKAESPLVIATNASLPSALNHKLEYGDFFGQDVESTSTAVIGKEVASNLFKDEAPLGRSFTFRSHTFIVRGVFEDFRTTPLSPTADFNNAIFIPYPVAEQISGGGTQMYAILAKPHDPQGVERAVDSIEKSLKAERGGTSDFRVLDQQRNVEDSSNVLSLLTTMIAAVAAISLLVGGVGIMNIMLATVTERTHEIGVRKAIGATNRQIMNQFVLESAVISMIGGFLGVVISVAGVTLLRLYTSLKPIISWEAIAIATVVSLAIGIVFGATPALKAAQKDPIESLRHE